MTTKRPIILACLDESARAPLVYRTAVAHAKSSGADLLLFQAVPLPLTQPEFGYVTPAELTDGLVKAAQEKLIEMKSAEVPSRVMVEVGVPWDAICRVAKSEGAALIVLGSHGYGGIDRLLGTTAAKVVNHAHCSVLVVRE